MAGALKHIRPLIMLTVLLLLSLSACITYVPREDGTDATDVSDSMVASTESEKTPDGTVTEIETDSKGFPNLPEDDQTKRY